MNLFLRHAKVLQGSQFVEKDVLVVDGAVSDDVHLRKSQGKEQVLDLGGMFLLPGFIDIHTHGALGVDFNAATEDEITMVSDFFASHGVTTYLPTVLTDTKEVMTRQLSLLSDPKVLEQNPTIGGIHLEGPFLNPTYKGAMPEELLLAPDTQLLKELYDASRGTIKVLTISPELPGALNVIRSAVSMGIRVSLGHSAASYEESMEAFDAGAVGTTHIMNAMKLLHMHDPAILTAVLEKDCFAEMICDGFHLHPPIVRLLLKIKGYQKMICVTDSISATGRPDGHYWLGVNRVEVKYGDAKVIESGARAGSTLTMDQALRNVMAYTGKELSHISPLMSGNAAAMLNLDAGITARNPADFVVLDSSLQVMYTIKHGRVLFQGAHDA